MAEANTESGHFLIGPPVDTAILTRAAAPTHVNHPPKPANCEDLRAPKLRSEVARGRRPADATVAEYP
jgi:hypothetical protein